MMMPLFTLACAACTMPLFVHAQRRCLYSFTFCVPRSVAEVFVQLLLLRNS